MIKIETKIGLVIWNATKNYFTKLTVFVYILKINKNFLCKIVYLFLS